MPNNSNVRLEEVKRDNPLYDEGYRYRMIADTDMTVTYFHSRNEAANFVINELTMAGVEISL